MTGLWSYAAQFMSAHELWVRMNTAVLPVYEYDPADDGPEVGIIRWQNGFNVIRQRNLTVADAYLTIGAAYLILADV